MNSKDSWRALLFLFDGNRRFDRVYVRGKVSRPSKALVSIHSVFMTPAAYQTACYMTISSSSCNSIWEASE